MADAADSKLADFVRVGSNPTTLTTLLQAFAKAYKTKPVGDFGGIPIHTSTLIPKDEIWTVDADGLVRVFKLTP